MPHFVHLPELDDLSEADADEFLNSEGFAHALAGFKARKQDATRNLQQGVHRTVVEVDVATRPLKDADGATYLPIRCAVCSTRHRVRALKRHEGREAKAKPEQLTIEQADP